MHPGDIKEFGSMMAMLGEVFDKEVSSTLAEVYFRALSEWSIEELNIAVWEHIATGQYFPKPAELITLALTYRTKQLPPAQRKCAISGCPGDPVWQFCAYHGG